MARQTLKTLQAEIDRLTRVNQLAAEAVVKAEGEAALLKAERAQEQAKRDELKTRKPPALRCPSISNQLKPAQAQILSQAADILDLHVNEENSAVQSTAATAGQLLNVLLYANGYESMTYCENIGSPEGLYLDSGTLDLACWMASQVECDDHARHASESEDESETFAFLPDESPYELDSFLLTSQARGINRTQRSALVSLQRTHVKTWIVKFESESPSLNGKRIPVSEFLSFNDARSIYVEMVKGLASLVYFGK